MQQAYVDTDSGQGIIYIIVYMITITITRRKPGKIEVRRCAALRSRKMGMGLNMATLDIFGTFSISPLPLLPPGVLAEVQGARKFPKTKKSEM